MDGDVLDLAAYAPLENTTNEEPIAVDDLRIGDRVKYWGLDGDIVESAVLKLVRDRLARIVGFYPLRTGDVDPNLAVTLDRIVKVSPREW